MDLEADALHVESEIDKIAMDARVATAPIAIYQQSGSEKNEYQKVNLERDLSSLIGLVEADAFRLPGKSLTESPNTSNLEADEELSAVCC